jgi:hypothetical protein
VAPVQLADLVPQVLGLGAAEHPVEDCACRSALPGRLALQEAAPESLGSVAPVPVARVVRATRPAQDSVE